MQHKKWQQQNIVHDTGNSSGRGAVEMCAIHAMDATQPEAHATSVDGVPMWTGNVALLNSMFAHVYQSMVHSTMENVECVFVPTTYEQEKTTSIRIRR